MKRQLIILFCILFVSVIIISNLINSNSVKAATETANATFSTSNEVPIIRNVRVTTNATGVTNTYTKPTNVTYLVNFTVFWTDLNANSVAILVCRTNAAGANGCTAKPAYVNETTFATTNRSATNKTTLNLTSFKPYYNNTNTTIAYLFLSDGQGVSTSRNVSFSVNHAPTMTVPGIIGQGGPNNYTNETYTASPRNLYDVDNANNTVKFGSYRMGYRWFRSTDAGSTWAVTVVTTQTFDCGVQTCNEADRFITEVRARDSNGYTNASGLKNSTSLIIVNSPPLVPTAFQVRDGTGSLDASAIFDTHARNGTGPEIKWTDGSDPDSDTTFTYVCARTDPVNNLTTTRIACHPPGLYNVTRVAAGTQYKPIGSTNYNPSANANTTYIALITTDGSASANSTILNVTLYINNSKPTVTADPLNVSRTHDQTPVVRWLATDFDNGQVDGWPADDLAHFIRVGTTLAGSNLNKSNDANNNSYIIIDNIAWNATVGNVTASSAYWSNRTVYVDLWTYDQTGTSFGNSTKVQDTFVLFDYLPRIVFINMSNHLAASGYLSCANVSANRCQLTPIEKFNTTVAAKITIEDRDGDCSNTNADAWLVLCKNQTTTAICAEAAGSVYRFNLSRVNSGNSSRCFLQRTANGSNTNSPEFFINNTRWKLYVNVSNNESVKRRQDLYRNGSWFYVGLNAVNYSTAITLGNGSVKLGGFSFGKTRYVLRNYGNKNVTLDWNMSDPKRSGGTEYWPLGGGFDVQIDDDNNITLETEGVLSATNITRNNNPGVKFQPLGKYRLAACVFWNCSLNTWNETLNTHWHIKPPANLTAGTYLAKVFITSTT